MSWLIVKILLLNLIHTSRDFQFTSINSYSCENVPQSAQQLYYNFYNLLALSQLKAYILLQITNMIKFLGHPIDTGMVRFNFNNMRD